MQEWIRQTLQSPEFGPAILPAAFLLGLLGSVTSCCTPAVVGMMAGYSGSGQNRGRRAILLAGTFFLVGTVAALAVLGAVAGFVSRVAGSALGAYWQLFGGLLAVLFGLVTLNLLPFRFRQSGAPKRPLPKGIISASLFGFVVGGTSMACMVCCNPLISVPLMVAVLQGETMWGAALLAAFALGYSLPLAALLVGLQASFEKLRGVSNRVAIAVRSLAGVVLIAAGFYLLVTV